MKKTTSQPTSETPAVMEVPPRLKYLPLSIDEKASILKRDGKHVIRITRVFANLDDALSWLLQDSNPERFINLILRGSSSASAKTSVSFDTTASANMELFADGHTITSSPSE